MFVSNYLVFRQGTSQCAILIIYQCSRFVSRLLEYRRGLVDFSSCADRLSNSVAPYLPFSSIKWILDESLYELAEESQIAEHKTTLLTFCDQMAMERDDKKFLMQ